jgi:hypothetical protein
MKLKLLLIALVSLPLAAFAADAVAPVAATGLAASDIVQWLTPVLVPLLIAGLKKVLPSIPGYLLPIIAPVLGVVLDLINSFATSHATNLWAAAALGLAGVGVREVKDQLSPAKPAL